jgi:prepilin-type N-terminal cleavage/methylation domain-containing protein
LNIRSAQRGKHGFSLVELLLTLVLILCLAAASVFTFTAIYKTANLDEGSDRFQSLIRFAQAEAATTGRKVRLQFVPAVNSAMDDASAELREIKVTWEADLLNAPGVFQEFTNKAWSEEIVNELVGVTKVAAVSDSGEHISAQSDSLQGGVAQGNDRGNGVAGESGELSESSEFPSITFYPDGSCDSAEVVLASRNGDDERRLAVRLGGLLGTVSTRTVNASPEGEAVDPEEAAFEEFNQDFESSVPVSESSRHFSASETSADFAE